MSDEGGHAEQGQPSVVTPVTGVESSWMPRPTPITGVEPGPAPLPLPLATDSGAPKRRRTGLIVVASVVATLIVCGLLTFAVTLIPESSFTGDGESVGSDVSSLTWVGGSRYAIAEFSSNTTEPTMWVVAWDSDTGRATKLDGFALVSTEPSSTRVWLTPASQYADDAASGYVARSTVRDRAGEAWAWDVASPEARPVRVAHPAWHPMVSASGVVASFSVDPDKGLWPDALTFVRGSHSVNATLPKGVATFLPLGWSPDGRYFAIADLGAGESLTQVVAILDSTDGHVASSYAAVDTTDTYEHLLSAAWDPQKSVVWLVGTRDTGTEETVSHASVRSLDVSGRRGPVRGAPTDWSEAGALPDLVGTDSSGVFVVVRTEAANGVFRIVDGVVTRVGTIDNSDLRVLGPDAYRVGRGLLVVESSMPATFDATSTVDSGAALLDLRSGDLRRIWPVN